MNTSEPKPILNIIKKKAQSIQKAQHHILVVTLSFAKISVTKKYAPEQN